jgi:hypothetical protein
MIGNIRVDTSPSFKKFPQRIAEMVGHWTEGENAVKAATVLVQQEWIKYISGSEVNYSGGTFTIHRMSGRYVQEVTNGLRYPYEGSKLKGCIEVDLAYADILDRGFSSFDMKPGLLKGKDYVDIPFEHSVGGLPSEIKQNMAGGRLANIRIGTDLKTFQLGQRTKLTPLENGLTPYTWRSGLYAGLTSTGAGQAFTFRRISKNSPPNAWMHPGQEPRPVTRALSENMEAQVSEIIRNGFERDLANAERGTK